MENQANNTMGASPCEAELQELMEQIDIMVSNKKLDWERKMRALETRLDLRDQELANAQTCLDQKGQEVGLLRQKLDSLEKCNLAMTQNYEGQLQTLKAQFSKLTNSFEKLRLHQMKQSKVRRKELLHPREEMPFELSNLNQKLEEFRAKSREWDKQEILYQTHLVSLDAQQKLLSEKCNQFQKQAQSYQTQLNGKKQCIEDGSSEVPQLMCEPDHSCEASERDEFIIEKLKSAVSEIALSRNKLQDENQKLLQELKMYQRQCQVIIYFSIDLAHELYKTSEITDIKSLDFTNREHSRHTSINKLEHENERLRNDLAKLHSNGKSAWANQNTYEEMGRYTYQNQMKMEKNEDRLSQDREPNRSVTPPLPPLPFQTREMTSPLVSDDEVFPLSPPDIVFPASLAAQHFLLEEEKRAKEFEKLLNTHIDELQKHTEFTLNKYTKLKQNRHI
uniref:deuterosome assembly protein 1 n=1 Tax=Panthera onca TaxID=9690 RepID=UPI002954F841|nr:deuterosome assembly protein 1 [Panthera onca]